MPANVRVREAALAALSAVLLILAEPPFHFLPLAFLALVPLAVALGSLPPGPRGAARASLLGFLFGGVFWGVSLVWVPLSVGAVFPWAIPAYVLLLVLLGGFSGLLGWAVHRLATRGGVSLGMAFPLAWVGMEWLRGHLPFGLSFPWLGLAPSLARWPALLGLAEWTGESGVSFWLAAVNAVVAGGLVGLDRRGANRAEAAAPGEGRRRTAPWSRFAPGLAALALGPALLGVLRSRTLSLLPGPTVVAVGTRVPTELRGRPRASAEEALGQVRRTLASDGAVGSVDLILLPEAVVPLPLGREDVGPFRSELERMSKRWGAPVVLGALAADTGGGSRLGLTNSVFLMGPGGGEVQRYDKVRLVPGMEAGRYDPGVGETVLRWGEWRYGPLLCYESLFGTLARRDRLAGAQVLLNLTSDIWFGRDGSALGALFLRQHPAHLVLRAVETRMSVVRAANGGYTLLLDPRGETVLPEVPPSGGVVRGRLATTSGLTLFVRFGDLVGPFCVGACLLLLLMDRRGERRGAGVGEHPTQRA